MERALNGARAFGHGSDLWTLERVAAVIEQVSGLRHHSRHVWRLLKEPRRLVAMRAELEEMRRMVRARRAGGATGSR